MVVQEPIQPFHFGLRQGQAMLAFVHLSFELNQMRISISKKASFKTLRRVNSGRRRPVSATYRTLQIAESLLMQLENDIRREHPLEVYQIDILHRVPRTTMDLFVSKRIS